MTALRREVGDDDEGAEAVDMMGVRAGSPAGWLAKEKAILEGLLLPSMVENGFFLRWGARARPVKGVSEEVCALDLC